MKKKPFMQNRTEYLKIVTNGKDKKKKKGKTSRRFTVMNVVEMFVDSERGSCDDL